MSDVSDLLTHAVNKSPIEFADAFNDLMQQKTRDAIEAHRVTLAQTIYDTTGDEDVADEGTPDDEDVVDGDTEEDYSDDDDLELDDLDDLEDIDLDDLDLDDEDGTDEDA